MVTPADAEARLRTLLVLADLEAHVLSELAEAATWLRVPAGVRLFSVGDAPDGMYGLLDGRVRFFLQEGGRPVMTAEAGGGITFGGVRC